MKNLVLLLALIISLVEVNATMLSWIEKDSSTYEENLQDEVAYDSSKDVIIIHNVLRVRKVIETMDTLGTKSFKLIHSGNSKAFLLKKPNCLWQFGAYKENERTKTYVITEKFNHNLRIIKKENILFVTKKDNQVLLETEESTESSLNSDAIPMFVVIIIMIFWQIVYFVRKYIKFFKEGVSFKMTKDDFSASIAHFFILMFSMASTEPLLSSIALLSFIIGGVLRIILTLNRLGSNKVILSI